MDGPLLEKVSLVGMAENGERGNAFIAATSLGRSCQDLFEVWELRTQLYVAVPATVGLGSPAVAQRMAASLLWGRLPLGWLGSWRKVGFVQALAVLISFLGGARGRWDIESAIMAKAVSKAASGASEKARTKAEHISAIAREFEYDMARGDLRPRFVVEQVRGKNSVWADAPVSVREPRWRLVGLWAAKGLPSSQAPRRSASG